MSNQVNFPQYLSSFEELEQHFSNQLEGLNTTEKGQRFAHFVQRLIPQTDIGAEFDLPSLNEKISNDGGVDLTANSRLDDGQLVIQSKLSVGRAEAIDSILSKFQSYASEEPESGQGRLLFDEPRNLTFLLVTLSPLQNILESYKKQRFSSKAFYTKLLEGNRIHFIDGKQIFQVLRTTYNKLNQIPATLTLNFQTPYIEHSNVFIGILSCDELKALYQQFGDALFFENVRDFLGIPEGGEKTGRTTPNLEISKTITYDPAKLLSRNNGIVFGAGQVERGANPSQLILHNGSVVNGCQTTMCIVEYANQLCSVLAKVVQTEDAWDITKSANYQTSIADIDLDLARYLRPQLAKRAGNYLGVQVENGQRSAFQVIDEIYDHKVAYKETRLLYIGLFSRSPNNVFDSNYTELMQELIKKIFHDSAYEDDVLETIFLLQQLSQKSLENAKAIYTNPAYTSEFARLFEEERLPYRCFLSILALCGSVNVNIADRRSDSAQESERMNAFLDNARTTLKSDYPKFLKYYRFAVKLWMQEMIRGEEEEDKLRRNMHHKSKRLSFTNMFRNICMEADLSTSEGK